MIRRISSLSMSAVALALIMAPAHAQNQGTDLGARMAATAKVSAERAAEKKSYAEDWAKGRKQVAEATKTAEQARKKAAQSEKRVAKLQKQLDKENATLTDLQGKMVKADDKLREGQQRQASAEAAFRAAFPEIIL